MRPDKLGRMPARSFAIPDRVSRAKRREALELADCAPCAGTTAPECLPCPLARMKFASDRNPLAVVWSRAVVACVTVAMLGGCHHWVPLHRNSLRDGHAEIRLAHVRVSSPTEVRVVEVHRVDYPHIDGLELVSHREVRLDVERWLTLDVERFDGGATAALVIAIIVGTGLVALAGFAWAISGLH